jgi:ATP-dependent exoDNAse (exonuclease V) beta subunit
MLALKNLHERDSRIRFDEGPHVYYVDGSCQDYVSVTTFVHKFFPTFNADEVISKMFQGRNWTSSPWFGMTRTAIKEAWKANSLEASTLGTAMHANIERFYNGEEHIKEGKEWELFEQFHADHKHLKPYRTEMTIFDTYLKIAGSIDMLFHDPAVENGLIIMDWKRSKEVRTSNKWQKGTHPATVAVQDCNYNHYSLQMGLYKAILQRNYGFTITGMFIVVLHPNQEKYIKLEAKPMDAVIAALFFCRRSELLDLEKENVLDDGAKRLKK